MAAAEVIDLRRRTLRERARRLAAAPEPQAEGERLELLVFDLARETYAVETAFVREAFTLKDLTPVPCTPHFVLGIINVRSEFCPVIDLKRLFGLPERGLTNATCAVILRRGAIEFGIVADVVIGVRTVPVDAIAAPPATLAGVQAEFLRGVTGDGLIVVDAARVLGHPSMIVREQVPD